MTVELPLSVWTTAQIHAQAQRTGRYVPESVRHPARMLPAIARAAITAY
jgi:modification methylase